VTQQHVLHDVQVVTQREVLVDGRDAEIRGIPRRVDMDRPAVPYQLAAARRPDARDGLDERRLACPVVPDQRGHLPGRDVKVDPGEGLYRAEVLADAP
jgi:hypothetical protein